MAMRVLVCGGRDYQDYGTVEKVLDDYHKEHNITVIIHGAATGADMLGEKWAKFNEILYCGIPAKWKEHNKAAGPIRNKWMAENMRVQHVIAFPGGNGTRNMIKEAKTREIPVLEIDYGSRF